MSQKDLFLPAKTLLTLLNVDFLNVQHSCCSSCFDTGMQDSGIYLKFLAGNFDFFQFMRINVQTIKGKIYFIILIFLQENCYIFKNISILWQYIIILWSCESFQTTNCQKSTKSINHVSILWKNQQKLPVIKLDCLQIKAHKVHDFFFQLTISMALFHQLVIL